MSERLKRRYSSGVRNALSVVPNVYETMGATEERFLPSADQQRAPTNKIKSTRYTPLTFFPIALFLQYKKVVVCVYTFNTVMQSIKSISTNSPLISLIPVVFVILVGMSKELYLECKRYKDDKRINQTPCRILRGVDPNAVDSKSKGLNFEDS